MHVKMIKENMALNFFIILSTGLEKIMKNSRDNDELLAVWEGWRHATVNLKAQFTTLVVYLNEAVQNSGI